MEFFIADNDRPQLTALKRLLERAYAGSVIWPSLDKTFTSWHDVAEEMEAHTRDKDDLVVVLDLALESESMASVRTGVEQAFQMRSLRPKGVFVAYTQWPEFAEGLPHYKETFDGLIDKQMMHGYESMEQQQSYVRRIVSGAIRKRAGGAPAYVLKDSLGLRLAAATFGQGVLDALVEEVADGWETVEITALTSGHSGAFLLAISGQRQGGAQRIIVKCARDREVIEDETRRVRSALGELGPLAEVLAPIDQQLHLLSDNRGYYYRQAEITGESLLSTLQRTTWRPEAESCLAAIMDLEGRCYSRGSGRPFGRLRPIERFLLSPIDAGRAQQSLSFLVDAGGTLVEMGEWPEGYPTAREVSAEVSWIIEHWKDLLGRQDDLLSVGQHGDMNPGNVLVPAPDRVVLIDFSRLGTWPVGYDVARLAAILRIRLTDQAGQRDWVQNRLQYWMREDFCSIDNANDPSAAVCPAATYCDQRFRVFVETRDPSEREPMGRGYRLGTLWDLIKVLSYGDLSPFKRLWVLINCWRLGRLLKFVAKP